MSPATPPRRPAGRPVVVVVGAGVSGLSAAWELSGGAAGPAPGCPEVVVLEAAATPGGKLVSAVVGGRPVDLAADGFLGRRPEAAAFCREVGLGAALRPVGASGASVWARGRARPLPEGLVLGVPTRLWPTARSGLLGLRGTLRLAVDVVAPRADRRRPLGDRAVGPLVARKLGSRVVEALVDPMVGGIHAGTVADMSTAAVFPLLLAVAQRRGSFMKSLRAAVARGASPGLGVVPGGEGRAASGGGDDGDVDARDGDAGAGPAPGDPPPLFWALEGGLGSLAPGAVAALAARGVEVRCGRAVTALHRGDGGRAWVLETAGGRVAADGVVLAVPAPAAAALLAPHQEEASKLLGGIDYAPVATVTLVLPADALDPDRHGTGLLVPRGTVLAGTGHDGPALVTAVTYLDRKWPHLAAPGRCLLRASVGRVDDERHALLDDAALMARVRDELRPLVGLSAEPREWRVGRWPAALPQYRVHHLLRVTGIEAALERLPAVAVAGAAYRGVGVPACVASGRAAARAVAGSLGVAAGPAPP